MKWYTCCNEKGLISGGECLIAAVHSCLDNTSLLPHIVYYGKPNRLMSYFSALGAKVVVTKSPLQDELIQNHLQRKIDIEWLLGVSLRFHVPLLEDEDDYILYTDTDVIFESEFEYKPVQIALAAANELIKNSGEYLEASELFNAGVIVLNSKMAKLLHKNFCSECIKIARGTIEEAWYDQGILNRFYRRLWSPLPQFYNHRPFHSISAQAKITHFQFLKPNMTSADGNLLANGEPETSIYRKHKDIYLAEKLNFRRYINFEALQALKSSVPEAITSEY